MITPSLSGAQLDTIDVDELRDAVAIAQAVGAAERHSPSMEQRTVVLFSRTADALIHAFAGVGILGNSEPGVTQTLEVTPSPTLLEPSWPKSDRPLSNPSAPIPERIRRQSERRR